MDKKRNYCVIDELKRNIYRYIIDSCEEDLIALQDKHPVPEKDSPLAKYDTEEVLDEKCVTGDGQTFCMETFMPASSGRRRLPVIVNIQGGGFVKVDKRYRRQYLKALACRGFLVFSFDYILSDDTSITRELKYICSIIGVVAERMKDFGTDPSGVFLTGDSAGAYLALYIAAISRSEKLRKIIGCGVPALTFTALGLHSGMFYVDRCDLSGFALGRFECSMSDEEKKFQKYINPECDEVIRNLPPVFLSTSRSDFFNSYTLSYNKALKRAGRKSKLVYRGNRELIHSFPAILPNLPESIDVMDMMTVWFGEQSEEAKKEEKRHKEEQKALDRINKRIESGAIIEQKTWQFIKELNSFSKERLDSVAIVDGRTEYTYRKMFRKWERYAEVFSALGMTGEKGARVLVRGTPVAETSFAVFGLNMTGASVSLGMQKGANSITRLKGICKNENITDLLVTDNNLSERYLRRTVKEKKALGIRNVIVMHTPRMGEFAYPWEEGECLCRYRRLKRIDGVLFMDDLLKKYKGFPISLSDDICDDAMITHTSGTTTGAFKPVPASDRGINETSARLLADSRFETLKGRASTILLVELASAYALYDELLLPLAFGGRLATLPATDDWMALGPDTLRALSYYHVNVFFGGPFAMAMLMKLPIRPDLTDLEFIFLGGSYASVDARKRYNRYLKKCGSDARVSVGYGLTEAGGACMLSSPDREDDSIGRPFRGIKIRLYDEEKDIFLDPADGPAEGVMHISSPAVSCGHIDDNVIFELVEIDGEKYLNTYDLVRTGEDGAFYYCGRMNKYFVNNRNVRFDAGLVESAVAAQPDIESCGLVPGYDKMLRDTVPVLYVKPVKPAGEAKNAVKNALIRAFIKGGAIKNTNLPSECIITDAIPYNASGKVNTHQILTGKIDGYRYRVIPLRKDGELYDIRLAPYTVLGQRGLPEEMENA
ncbi:MAG: AMP-binding protein [Lachnospiraceae bacterium]|nr:AMP-binding protein [Lachnospiraceae bacterium]